MVGGYRAISSHLFLLAFIHCIVCETIRHNIQRRDYSACIVRAIWTEWPCLFHTCTYQSRYKDMRACQADEHAFMNNCQTLSALSLSKHCNTNSAQPSASLFNGDNVCWGMQAARTHKSRCRCWICLCPCAFQSSKSRCRCWICLCPCAFQSSDHLCVTHRLVEASLNTRPNTTLARTSHWSAASPSAETGPASLKAKMRNWSNATCTNSNKWENSRDIVGYMRIWIHACMYSYANLNKMTWPTHLHMHAAVSPSPSLSVHELCNYVRIIKKKKTVRYRCFLKAVLRWPYDLLTVS